MNFLKRCIRKIDRKSKNLFKTHKRMNIIFYNVKPYFSNCGKNNFFVEQNVKVFDDHNEKCLKAKQYCNFSNLGTIKIKKNNHLVAPFDLITLPHGEIIIGENVRIMRNSKIYSKNHVEIGDFTCIAENVHIRDFSGHLINGNDDCNPVVIGKAVWIGANVTILPGVHIGNGSIIGACSVVTKDIPDKCLVVGNPARVIKTNVSWGENDYSLRNGGFND